MARTLPPLPTHPLPAKLEELRVRQSAVAAKLRELEWKNDVGMTELSGWEYGTRTREMAEVLGGDELRALGRLAAAGGVLPEGIDLVQLAASFTAASAGATYSPLDKQVLIVGALKNDSLLTHEFVHALQDQNFDLLKLLVARPYNFDRAEAAFAVVEGDAMNVQRRAEQSDSVYARRSLDDITRQENERFGEYRAEIGKVFPPLLTETFIFRYRDGARFVEALRRRGGERAVDQLFLRPPASSEQVLHTEKYLSNEAPRETPIDEAAFGAANFHLIASTPLGEIGIRGLLMAAIPEREAVRAAAGWGGDCAYLFEHAQQSRTPLFVWKTSWDKPIDAEEFFRAYNALQRAHNSSNTGGDQVSDGQAAQTNWRENGRLTIVRREGDSVIVVRSPEADAAMALEIARQ
ncbi:MAG: hypothetical protein ABR577_08560 [Pyrinomonadaceae bacterium]